MLDGFALHRIVLDSEGRPTDYVFLEANQAFQEFTGLHREAVIGKRVTEVLPGITESAFDWIGTYGRVALTGEPVAFEQYFEPLDRWYEVKAYCPERGYFAALFHDITERTRAERDRTSLLVELRHRAIQLEAVVESTQAQFALLDREMRFLMVNSAYERRSGHTRDELLGRNHFDLFPNVESQAIFERVRDTGVRYEAFEKPFEYADQPERGVTYWNWVLAPIKDEQGHTRELLLSLLDVTDQVRSRQRVEAAVKMREEFISVAAHELKTPVTSLKGFAQVVQRSLRKTGAVDPERLARAMQTIDEQSSRLARLTDQMLDISRLEAEKFSLSRHEADLVGLVENVVLTFRHLQPDRIIELRVSGPIRASVDQLRLEQVFTNLVDNALKFSPSETPVEIEVASEAGGKAARVSVRDHGLGVPESERERIFERFRQVHAGQHYGGIGIGLYVSRQYVELHGGTITVERPDGAGSRFVVRLPVAAGDRAAYF